MNENYITCLLIFIIIIIIILYTIKYYRIYKPTNYPTHIAFIMDGNGRWATEQTQNRSYGHQNSSHNLEDIIYDCFYNNVTYLTFYIFSEQNWNRPKEEIKCIFETLYTKLKIIFDKNQEIDSKINGKKNHIMSKGVRILVQGRLDRLPIKLREILVDLIEMTKNMKKTIILCIDYSGRSEILNACQKLIDNKLKVTPNNFINNMYVNNIPDPDMIIRTGGEQRLSEFLLWQSSYSELYFTNKYWPEFNVYELKKAIYNYNMRQRRYGKIM